MALRVRDATGTGQQVQVNLLSSLLPALVNQGAAALAMGNSPGRLGNTHPSIAPYETFRTGRGRLTVAVGNDRQFAALASALGLRGLSEQAIFLTNERRVASREELRIVIEAALHADTAASWQKVDECALRDSVRAFVDSEIKPHIATWYEKAIFPLELVPELAKMGLLGMHLKGYGCAGRSAVEYGLAGAELEARDSGLRTFVSVQGSLAMSAIYKHGSDEQKAEWLPAPIRVA